jgi:hypothetical protein
MLLQECYALSPTHGGPTSASTWPNIQSKNNTSPKVEHRLKMTWTGPTLTLTLPVATQPQLVYTSIMLT